jgi:hypothetical protein
VALGLAARGVHLARGLSYWYDEAYLLLNIFQRDCAALLGRIDHSQVMPPLFLWLLRGVYRLGGGSEWVMRLPAAAAGVAAVGLMFPLARRVLGRPGWIWAVCFVALSGSALLHGTEVHPYTFDLLTTEAVLLGAVIVLCPDSSPGVQRGGWAALWGLAVLGPWLSFPSAFSLGAVSAAFLWANRKGASRRAWLAWLLLNGLTALSGLALWYFSARHLYYPGMNEAWGPQGWSGFPDGSRPGAAVLWGLARLSTVCQYATDDMGYPMAILAVIGFAGLARRASAVAVCLAAPLLLATAAAFLGKYPFADRTTLFAAPCVWLAAAAGVEAVRQRLLGRWPLVGLLMPAVLLAPGALHLGKLLVVSRQNPEFRQAFAFVQEQRQAGDEIWASHVEVYQVYHGPGAPVLDVGANEQLIQVARHHRVWMVSTLSPILKGPSSPEALRRVEEAGGRRVLRREFRGLEVVLYEPPAEGRARSDGPPAVTKK